MSSHLTYRPREGVIFGIVDGKPIRLMTERNPGATSVDAWRTSRPGVSPATAPTGWPKMQELRSGRSGPTTPGVKLTVAEQAPLEIYDYPGEYAQRFDGKDKTRVPRPTTHPQHRRIVTVDAPGTPGIAGQRLCLHGPPACVNPRCIVILEPWESLVQALASAGRVSINVEL
jgi:hypothetical protein